MKTYENALQIIADNYAIIGKERHELAAMVIDKYKSSTEPFDILGVDLLLGRYPQTGKRNAETTPVTQFHALSSQQPAKQDLTKLADGHHRLGRVQRSLVGEFHRYLGLVRLGGSYLSYIPFLRLFLVQRVYSLHGFY